MHGAHVDRAVTVRLRIQDRRTGCGIGIAHALHDSGIQHGQAVAVERFRNLGPYLRRRSVLLCVPALGAVSQFTAPLH